MRARLVGIGAALLMALTGCGGSNGSEGEQAAADTPLRIATSWEITSIDPLTEGYWAPEFGYGELLLRPTATGEQEPWVLESAEARSPTEWQLAVRDGVTFQNGKPCDAEAVAALINHQLAENTVLAPILPGATAEVTGPRTVTLTTKAPVSFVPELLADEAMFPVFDVKAYKAAGEDRQALIRAGLYTGPYKVVELTAERMVLERNAGYWQGRPALTGVMVRFIPDHQARILAVESGEVDLALYPPTEAARTLEHSAAAKFVSAEHGTSGPRIIFNLDKPPIDDALMRRALSAAVDYEAIANEVMDGRYDVARGLFPAHLPFAVANQMHDLAAAGALLDQAGWVASGDGTRAKDGRPLALTLVTYRTDPDMQPIAVALRSQLEEVGIDVRIREIESSAQLFDKDFDDWHFALILSSYFGISGGVVSITHDYLTSDGARNAAGVADREVDAIADELATEFDEERRNGLLRELQEVVIAENAYTIVVSEKQVSAVASKAWADYQPSSNYLHVDWRTAP